jgi:predicted O-methyltransferase YrrM
MTNQLIRNIDRAVCLTLDKNIRYAKELQKSAIDHDINIQLFIAGDGSYDILYDHIDLDELPPCIPDVTAQSDVWGKVPNLYNGFLCHRKIIQQAYKDGCNNLLLFEDDAVFMDNFDEIVCAIDPWFQKNDWDIIYLGNFVYNIAKHTKVYNHIYRIGDECFGFHGVLINRKILEIAKDFPPHGAMDCMFVQKLFNDKHNIYFIDPSIIGQKAGYSATAEGYCNAKRLEPHKYEQVFGWFGWPDLYREMVDRYDSGIFVELGSYQGRSAIYMAELLQIEKKYDIQFYCVDLWPSMSSPIMVPSQYFDSNEIKIAADLPQELYHTFITNIKNTKTIDRINIIRDHTVNAAKIFEDNSVDFIYIDAGHKYEQVVADINAWYPKIKNGGIIAGHDFKGGPVKQAVVDTLPNVTEYTHDENTWICVK